MTPEQARDLVEETLHQVAPNADTAGLDGQADLREELELDSLDFLSFVEGLSTRVNRRIEEDDYSRLSTLDRCVAYLTDASR